MKYIIKRIIGMLLILAVLHILSPLMTYKEDVTKFAKSEEWKEFKTTGYSYFGCIRNGFYHTKFKATTKDNKRISGVVCTTWKKHISVLLID